MNALASEIKFPAVAFSRGGSVLLAKDIVRFSTCTPAALHHGYYDGLRIIDGGGRCFVVSSATRAGTSKPWWRTPVFVTYISVELGAKSIGTTTVDELKQDLLKAFRENRGIWEAPQTYEGFRAGLTRCGSFPEIAAFLEGPQGAE